MSEKIISKQEVKKVADLARIEISPQEEEKFASELNSILGYFKDLSEVETNGQEKFDHYNLERNQFRPDEVVDPTDDEKEKIRSQFPNRKGDLLKVKEVLANGN